MDTEKKEEKDGKQEDKGKEKEKEVEKAPKDLPMSPQKIIEATMPKVRLNSFSIPIHY